MVKCYECEKGNLVKKNIPYTRYGTNIGKFPALVCSKCNEVFYEGNSVEKIEKKLKAKGLWGLGIKTVVGTSGTSLDIKISKKLEHFFDLKKGQEILVEPVSRRKFEVSIL